MDLRWLSAPDDEVAEAMRTVRQGARPRWVPSRRKVLAHVNDSLLLWGLCLVLMYWGVVTDGAGDGTVTPSTIAGLAGAAVVLAVWFLGSRLLHRWAARPPSPRARGREWRQHLTALANGFEPDPMEGPSFRALITTETTGVVTIPRFRATGVEFGVVRRKHGSHRGWTYVALALPVNLPHLVLDATANDRHGSDLPASVLRDQRLSLEGDFDRHFRLYAPGEYERDALYLLTPDVMAALVDDAADFNVEVIDRRVVFFRRDRADHSTPEPWEAAGRIIDGVGRRLLRRARVYRDDRVLLGDAGAAPSLRADRDEQPPDPRIPIIAADGRRLDVRDRRTGTLGCLAWFVWVTFRFLLLFVPAVFAFAGFMSIVDGR
ncbi:hypothetical protein DZG00_08800 [Clavibacter lycopersici]|uniref:DUF3137 domain-containing protein n=1 Tax=Clavibacter lycopersici TaxID=2301718 RepID=A0A399T6T9_9MICO|nr:hypothetical protein [Clavibacter lycopersici]RIJ51458.1 hypothetical protein DZG00_08800 [Clavibacter lycopersici]RIJ61355.1 hypothetical protein DZG02_07425 [Clavibacter lycopersici]